MAWIDYRLPFRASQELAPKCSAEELLRLLWERWARSFMGNRLRGRAYYGIFHGGYVDSQAAGGLATKKWKPEDGSLLFRFHDADGLFALQSRACAHFTEVSFATMLEEDHLPLTMKHEGWILESTRDATAALEDCATPLMDLRGVLYLLSPGAKPEDPPALLTDPRLPGLSFAELTSAEQQAVREAVDRRRCACLLCEYYRPRIAKLLEKRAAKAHKSAAKERKGAAPKKPAATRA